MPDKMQIFSFLFLMLGPFKLVGPFAKITMGADPGIVNKLAFRAMIFSSLALLAAAVLGEIILDKYRIPLPILGISGGIILFLVALLHIIHQFAPAMTQEEKVTTPTMNMAITPLAFPSIVTPYGIAAVIMILALCPDLSSKLVVGEIVVGIMVLNLITMLITRFIYKPLAIFLAVLGAVLGVIQVALGLMVIYNQTRALLNL